MKTSAVRIVEWTEEVLVQPSEHNHQIECTPGHTMLIEMEDDERLDKLEVMPTPIARRVEVPGGTARMKLYACQAFIVTDEVDIEAIEKAREDAAREAARSVLMDGVNTSDDKKVPGPPDPPISDEDRPVG